VDKEWGFRHCPLSKVMDSGCVHWCPFPLDDCRKRITQLRYKVYTLFRNWVIRNELIVVSFSAWLSGRFAATGYLTGSEPEIAF
jgi:hypothetical protein